MGYSHNKSGADIKFFCAQCSKFYETKRNNVIAYLIIKCQYLFLSLGKVNGTQFNNFGQYLGHWDKTALSMNNNCFILKWFELCLFLLPAVPLKNYKQKKVMIS